MASRKLNRAPQTRPLPPEEVSKGESIRRKMNEEFPSPPRVAAPEPQSIAESLKQAIGKSGCSVYQIAKESGISQIVIARFLSGERDIRMATADKLAHVLKLQLTAG